MIFKKIINKNFYILLFLILIIGIYFRLNFYNDGIWPDEWISFYISVSDLDFLEKLNLHLAREGSSPINLIFNNIIYFFVGYNYQNFELSFLVINIISILFFLQITEQKEKKFLIFFLLSLNPMLIYYSGEIRFYTLSVLFSILSVIFFFKLQNFNSKLNILAFTIFTLISLLTNIYSVSLLLSYFIYNFFKKNNKFFYIILFLIFIFFLILNFNYFEKMVIDYFSGSYGVAGNIDRKFFLGYFFNIFFGNILLGALFLILFATSPLFFKLDVYNNDKLFLFYIIIFSSYFIPIFFSLLGKNVTFPRHLIFIVPFIIYILTSLLFSIKNKYFKRTLIISVIILSFYSNTFSDRPFMQIKPNPDGVLKILNSQNLKKLLIHGIPENANSSDIIERKKIYCNVGSCAFENLVFLYSKNFDIDKIDLIFHDNYLSENEFWSICLHLPSYRGDNTKENDLKNCYRNLDHIEKSHYQAKNFINNEFNLTLYKSR